MSPLCVLRKPNDQQLRQFLDLQAAEPLSYREIGQSNGGSPAGYNVDHNRVLLGHGQAAFDAACTALLQWRMFPAPWTTIWPAGAKQETGTAVVMMARVYGLWWVNACRVVYRADQEVPARRYGFAYGTLHSHVEQGEERFMIEWDQDDKVWYDLRAFSRPRFWIARVGYPITRRLQRRFVLDSQSAMRRIVGGMTANKAPQ
jgi:uncharacterized protein (UPF0548 family)